ncbi:hypothetical protein GCM10009527_020800 [Actinomadura nitritigenes]|uniref:MFS transporter n=1 Tax=Actinomadura nitritigenes TaxID=134602 RepID=A0ABS3QW34_9ACTN|nr:hypothetical protein [Actinomadura nitritigenes]MBO2438050.1 hypothetical protein [Actinomadura nitritigenes]
MAARFNSRPPVRLARARLEVPIRPRLQFTALMALPLSAVQPAMLAGLVLLPLIAGIGLGERLGRREAVCMALAAAATVLYARAAGSAHSFDRAPEALLLLAAIFPSLAFPAVLFLVSDLRRKGAHERPLSGITYGISAGMLIGAGEVALTGMATVKAPLDDIAASPDPYLFIAATALAAGQIQIAFQRCRLVIRRIPRHHDGQPANAARLDGTVPESHSDDGEADRPGRAREHRGGEREGPRAVQRRHPARGGLQERHADETGAGRQERDDRRPMSQFHAALLLAIEVPGAGIGPGNRRRSPGP